MKLRNFEFRLIWFFVVTSKYYFTSTSRKSPFQSFQTTIGTPQGDGLSPILFIIYLERALKDARNKAPPKPIEDKNISSEAIYADDTDFISKNAEYLKKLESIQNENNARHGWSME